VLLSVYEHYPIDDQKRDTAASVVEKILSPRERGAEISTNHLCCTPRPDPSPPGYILHAG